MAHKKIPLAEAEEGMVLAFDAKPAGGMALLREGTKLTAKSIETLKTRSVETVIVVIPGGEAEPEAASGGEKQKLGKAAQISKAELAAKRLDQVFADVADDATMAELLALAKARAGVIGEVAF